MLTDRELLANQDFQSYVLQNGPRLLGLDRILQTPTVIHDGGGNEEFWVAAINSPLRHEVDRQVHDRKIIPTNADVLADIASNHSQFHTWISHKGFPTIPTSIWRRGLVLKMGDYELPEEVPGIYVKKVSFKDGVQLSHRGQGVSMVKLEQLTQDALTPHLPSTTYELLQPFVVPPDQFMRDIRVYMIGGQPIVGIVRKAPEPLTTENRRGDVVPTIKQFPSAQDPEVVKEPLKEPLRSRVFERATQIASVLTISTSLRNRIYSPYSTWGFGSVDFLLDANGVPLANDFDLYPTIHDLADTKPLLARALAEYLRHLSTVGGIDREVVVIDPGQNMKEFIHQELTRQPLPLGFRIQERIIDQALKEMTRLEEKAQLKNEYGKIGRNKPCPCGSGLKFKKCHGH